MLTRLKWLLFFLRGTRISVTNFTATFPVVIKIFHSKPQRSTSGDQQSTVKEPHTTNMTRNIKDLTFILSNTAWLNLFKLSLKCQNLISTFKMFHFYKRWQATMTLWHHACCSVCWVLAISTVTLRNCLCFYKLPLPTYLWIHQAEASHLLHRVIKQGLCFSPCLQIACRLLSMWPSKRWKQTLLLWHGTSLRETPS